MPTLSQEVGVIFLDRDGVLVEDVGYGHRPEDLSLIPGAAKAVRKWNEQGRRVIVITNQSGLARGLFDEAGFHRYSRGLEELLAAEGARLDATYLCPHRDENACRCRKPRPGLLLRAIRDWRVDVATAQMIGDRQTDVDAALAAGVRGRHFTSGDLQEFASSLD